MTKILYSLGNFYIIGPESYFPGSIVTCIKTYFLFEQQSQLPIWTLLTSLTVGMITSWISLS